MSAAIADEHESFPRWLTSELRAKVGELVQQPQTATSARTSLSG
jgi:hypothetical protein